MKYTLGTEDEVKSGLCSPGKNSLVVFRTDNNITSGFMKGAVF